MQNPLITVGIPSYNHAKFLAKYQQILKPNATINLKTDSKPLFDFTQEVIAENNCMVQYINHNIYAEGEAPYPLDIKTHYEKMHLASSEARFLSLASLVDTGDQTACF